MGFDILIKFTKFSRYITMLFFYFALHIAGGPKSGKIKTDVPLFGSLCIGAVAHYCFG